MHGGVRRKIWAGMCEWWFAWDWWHGGERKWYGYEEVEAWAWMVMSLCMEMGAKWWWEKNASMGIAGGEERKGGDSVRVSHGHMHRGFGWYGMSYMHGIKGGRGTIMQWAVGSGYVWRNMGIGKVDHRHASVANFKIPHSTPSDEVGVY